MEEHIVTLTTADVWWLLGCIETAKSESTCDYDRLFEKELIPHLNFEKLEKKLQGILYGN